MFHGQVNIVDGKLVEFSPEDVLLEQLSLSISRNDNDPRWLKVRSSTPVYFEDTWTTWGDLAGNERMECTIDQDGVIRGGMPF